MGNFSSIKRFLLLAISGLIIVAWIVGAYSNFLESREQVEELFDAELAQMSRMIQSMIHERYQHAEPGFDTLEYHDEALSSLAFDDDEEEYNEWGHKYERKLAFRVWDKNGQLILENHAGLPTRFDTLKAGFSDTVGNHFDWRSFTLHDPQFEFWVHVAQREDVRTELTEEIALHSALPGLLLVPLVLVIIAWTVARGLAPLNKISRELKSRDYNNLSRLDSQAYPVELKHLVGELNSLFERVDESYERERRFTADAAHELRTPLSIAKVHLQNILQISQNEQVKDFVLKALSGNERLIHLVQQLLILSRLDAGIDASDIQPLNLSKLCESLCEEIESNNEYSTHIRPDLPSKAELFANESSLTILIRNLLDNACRYGSPDTPVEVILSEHSLTIRNHCEPLEASLLSSLTERFTRGKQQGASGSGLGLSICQRICEVYGYHLQLRNRDDGVRGFETTVVWSRPTGNGD